MLNKLALEVHKTAVSKGWWNESRSLGDQFANFHSEISEAWECYRNGNNLQEVWIDDDGKPEGIPIEFADCIIRILDTCNNYGIDIDKAIMLKMEYNKSRPYRHGGKLA